jgi:hypothetical protein
LIIWEESLTRSTIRGDQVKGIWDDNAGFRAHGEFLYHEWYGRP